MSLGIGRLLLTHWVYWERHPLFLEVFADSQIYIPLVSCAERDGRSHLRRAAATFVMLSASAVLMSTIYPEKVYVNRKQKGLPAGSPSAWW